MTESSFLPYSDAELVLGLVSPVETNLDRFIVTLEAILREFEYSTNTVRLSGLATELVDVSAPTAGSVEFIRLTRLMDAGNEARRRGGAADVLALAAAGAISRRRNGEPREPLKRTAHILRSLKHPGEVLTLRRIYGPAFFLYSTTFPCHNCAKHIIGAGIARVVYVEPYPKSRTASFYADSIHLGPVSACDERVAFEAFEGVGPRRFVDLLSMGSYNGYPVKRKVKGGRVREDWNPTCAEVRFPLLPNSYMQREQHAAEELVGRFPTKDGNDEQEAYRRVLDRHEGNRGAGPSGARVVESRHQSEPSKLRYFPQGNHVRQRTASCVSRHREQEVGLVSVAR